MRRLLVLMGAWLCLGDLARAENCESYPSNLRIHIRSSPGVNEFSTVTAAMSLLSPESQEDPNAPRYPSHCMVLHPDGDQDRTLSESITLPYMVDGKPLYKLRVEAASGPSDTGKVIWTPAAGSNGRVLTLNYSSSVNPFLGPQPAQVYAEGVTFEGGGSLNPGGGLVFANKSSFECVRCVFRRSSSNCGGAIAASHVLRNADPAIPAKIKVSESLFEENAACQGGAVDVRDGAIAEIHDSRFVNNRARAGVGLFVGAGAEDGAYISEANVTNSEFTQGGSDIYSLGLLGLSDPNYCENAISNPDYYDSTGICDAFVYLEGDIGPDQARYAQGRSGGAIEVHGNFSGDALWIHDNSVSGPGGGVYALGDVRASSFRMTSSVVQSNASADFGDGFYMEYLTPVPTGTARPTYTPAATLTPRFSPTATQPPAQSPTPTATITPTPPPQPGRISVVLWNNTVLDNAGQGLVLHSGDYQPDISNTIFWGNGSDLVGVAGDLSNSLVEVLPSGVTGAESVDPQFAAAGDFHLSASSPARNAADPRVLSAPTPLGSLDVDGHPRVLEAQLDIGADEYTTPLPTPSQTQTPSPSPTSTPVSVAVSPGSGGGSSGLGFACLAALLLAVVLAARERRDV